MRYIPFAPQAFLNTVVKKGGKKKSGNQDTRITKTDLKSFNSFDPVPETCNYFMPRVLAVTLRKCEVVPQLAE